MSVRRLHHEQPESFAFTSANAEWAQAQVAKFPKGRQASTVIPLLWRAQEQEGWVTRPMIEEIARLLGMDVIRVLEVATFYFMFQLQPVGRIAHVQVCGTTSCMICGAEDLIGICRQKIAPEPHQLSADGKFSWEEVECLGACSNAPMVQIGKDYYEDLTAESFAGLLDAFALGEVPRPGPQNGRWASEPATGRTSLMGDPAHGANASIELALARRDTVARITGEAEAGDMRPPAGRAAIETGLAEVAGEPAGQAAPEPAAHTVPDRKEQAEKTAPLRADEAEVATERAREEAAERQSPEAPAKGNNGSGMPPADELSGRGDAVMSAPPGHPSGRPGDVAMPGPPGDTSDRPRGEAAGLPGGPRGGRPDDLTRIRGIGPKLQAVLNELGIYHFDQIAAWDADQIAWIDARLGDFHGRVLRDDWVAQARQLAAGGEPGASNHSVRGDDGTE